jgi:prophage maintenance system killer protein
MLGATGPISLDDCDRAGLEASLAAPRAGFSGVEKYPNLASKAAALFYSVVKGHHCLTGNKRLAYVVGVVFLIKNDSWLWEDPDAISAKVEEVAASAAAEADVVRAELAAWISVRLLPAAEAAVKLQAKLTPGR